MRKRSSRGNFCSSASVRRSGAFWVITGLLGLLDDLARSGSGAMTRRAAELPRRIPVAGEASVRREVAPLLGN